MGLPSLHLSHAQANCWCIKFLLIVSSKLFGKVDIGLFFSCLSSWGTHLADLWVVQMPWRILISWQVWFLQLKFRGLSSLGSSCLVWSCASHLCAIWRILAWSPRLTFNRSSPPAQNNQGTNYVLLSNMMWMLNNISKIKKAKWIELWDLLPSSSLHTLHAIPSTKTKKATDQW